MATALKESSSLVDSTPYYRVDDWIVETTRYSNGTQKRDETIFAVANGFLGVRANFERKLPPGGLKGTYLNAFYESAPIVYPEGAHALAKNRQTMLNVIDAQPIEIFLGGQGVGTHSSGTISDFSQRLDMRTGIVTRSYVWSLEASRLRVIIERFVSFARENLFVQRVTLENLGTEGRLKVRSILDGNVSNQVAGDDPRVGSGFTGRVLKTERLEGRENLSTLVQRTDRTKFALACSTVTKLSRPAAPSAETGADEVATCYEISLKKGEAVVLEKFAAYTQSLLTPDSDLAKVSVELAQLGAEAGFEKLAHEHRAYLEDFWAGADVTVDGDPQLQQGIRFNLFHLLQSVGKNGRSNISAKGLTGEGYEGHFFWDTEVYVLPVFLFSKPLIARRLIEHRATMLPAARQRAAEMSQKGALFAWRTIGGEETSAYYPAGTAQYHINADVFLALKRYLDVTGDRELLLSVGAEVLFETARLWADLGCFVPGRGFCINSVTGPDEYSAVVNNNAYTNLMAKDHLEFAVETYRLLEREHGEFLKGLVKKINLTEVEIAQWSRAAAEMFLARDERLGIVKQDDSFLDRKPWDFKGTPKEKYPLLLNFHPLVIYRHQVLKQADTVLALLLQGDRFSRDEKKRNYDFYEPLTTHDSSLSTSIHAVVASELGYLDKAYDYFIHTSRTDLDDLHHNTGDGIHAAAMAGTWSGIVHGFAGMREHHDSVSSTGYLSFNPRLPAAWKGYSFRIRYKSSLLLVEVQGAQVRYSNLSQPGTNAGPIEIRHRSQVVRLAAGSSETRSIMNEVRGALFDLDGVLTDTAHCHFLAWKSIASELGLPFDEQFNEKLKGIPRMESLELILSQGSRSYTASEKLELCERKNARFREMVSKLTAKDVLPGVRELLSELKMNGIRCAVASASRNAREILERLDLLNEFEFVVDAAKVGKGKPDPETFVKAAEGLGLHPEECVGFEDSQAGIEALRACCMIAIGIASTAADLPGAHEVVPTMKGLSVKRILELAGRTYPVIPAPLSK